VTHRTTLTLTARQTQKVIRDATRATGPDDPTVLCLPPRPELSAILADMAGDPRYTTSLIRGLQILLAVPEHATPLKTIAQTADQVPSSAHRWLRTWVALGIVHQDEQNRMYRRHRSR
jgi:hypothetical protein